MSGGISPQDLLRQRHGVKAPQAEEPQKQAAETAPVQEPQKTEVQEPEEKPVAVEEAVETVEKEAEPEQNVFGLVNPDEAYDGVFSDMQDDDSDGEPIDDDSGGSELDEYRRIETAAERVKGRKIKPLKSSQKPKPTPERNEQIRDLSSTVMDVVRREFPQSTLSKADAIAAYVYVHSAGTEIGSNIRLSEKAAQAVREYSGDNTMSILDERLSHLERMVAALSAQCQVSELALAYIVCDRAFGIKSTQISPGDMEIRETGVLDVLDKLREQAAEQHSVDVISNGRPRRRRRVEMTEAAKERSKAASPPSDDDDEEWH